MSLYIIHMLFIILVILFVLLKYRESFWNLATRRNYRVSDIRGEPNLIYPLGYVYGPYHYGANGMFQKTDNGYYLY
jgi:hypothetical protein